MKHNALFHFTKAASSDAVNEWSFAMSAKKVLIAIWSRYGGALLAVVIVAATCFSPVKERWHEYKFHQLTRDIEEFAKYTPAVKNIITLGFGAYAMPRGDSWHGEFQLIWVNMTESNTVFTSVTVNSSGIGKTLQCATYKSAVDIAEVVKRRTIFDSSETEPFVNPSTYSSFKMDHENSHIMQKKAQLAEKLLLQILEENSARVIVEREKYEANQKAEWDKYMARRLASENAAAEELRRKNDAVRAEIKGEKQSLSVQF